ncbi:hypothetical protein DIS24_g11985 [Lasiodiplodia hormozganensis]|uniref:Uncharacterized protein n=1 Tax=Lasiodiplodia hormozganensis TaxID=869390 RepID=A0AA39TPW0_9PEZI|nr:hypothetical protein DIS24_g11985 [Lasiodiplodia hormozganensis]
MGTLINTEKLRVLYNEAESNRHEAYPTRFFNFFLQKIAFPEEEYWISSEQPPTDDPSDRKRVDLVVNYFSQDYKVRVLCFTELKRGRSAEKAIEENEDQAMYAASSYCHALGLPYVYVISAFGAKARFFSYMRDADSFNMMLAGDDPLSVADTRAYQDPDTPSGAAYWTRAIERMKRYPPTSVAGKQEAQPQWSQPNVGVWNAPTPVVASSERHVTTV